MAMEATHVRFAKTVMHLADVTDQLSYYTGSVYPDSRYYTKVDRENVHPRGFNLIEIFSAKADFEKGWMTHAYYDDKTDAHFKKWFGYTEIPTINDDWVSVTAVKLLEEIISVEMLGEDLKIFPRMQTPKGAFNEDAAAMQAYYDVQRTFYNDPPTTIDDFETLFGAFVAEHWPAVRDRSKQFQKDATMMKRISHLFDDVVKTVV